MALGHGRGAIRPQAFYVPTLGIAANVEPTPSPSQWGYGSNNLILAQYPRGSVWGQSAATIPVVVAATVNSTFINVGPQTELRQLTPTIFSKYYPEAVPLDPTMVVAPQFDTRQSPSTVFKIYFPEVVTAAQQLGPTWVASQQADIRQSPSSIWEPQIAPLQLGIFFRVDPPVVKETPSFIFKGFPHAGVTSPPLGPTLVVKPQDNPYQLQPQLVVPLQVPPVTATPPNGLIWNSSPQVTQEFYGRANVWGVQIWQFQAPPLHNTFVARQQDTTYQLPAKFWTPFFTPAVVITPNLHRLVMDVETGELGIMVSGTHTGSPILIKFLK